MVISCFVSDEQSNNRRGFHHLYPRAAEECDHAPGPAFRDGSIVITRGARARARAEERRN